MRKFFREFKEFISKGNVFDMAVGLIIATAFNKIVSSMVNDIIMPLVTWATGAASLSDLSIVLKETTDAAGEVVKLTWNYGVFIQTVIDFLIIAFSVFVMVKAVNGSRKKLEERASSGKEKRELRKERKAVRLAAEAEGRDFETAWNEYLADKASKEAAEKAAKEKAEAEAKKANPTEQELLKEIRDLLKSQNKKSSK